MNSFENTLLNKFKKITTQDKNFKEITTFKIGGDIKYLVYPNTTKELCGVIKLCLKHKVRWVVLGNGSNVLASDDFFEGVVICTKNLKNVKVKKNCAFAECGVMLFWLVLKTKERNLSGLEWAVGIPGTVGGAVVMNAGAFEKEIFDNLNYVLVFDGKRVKKLKKKDIKYSYRYTQFQNFEGVVLGASFFLLQKTSDEIEEKIEFFVQKRKNMQNICYPNAGSVFKKPQKDLSASALIDMLGLKGTQIGGAMISKSHAGFIVNTNNATCKDVQKLIDFILEKVYNMFNIILELEIVYIK